MLHFPPYLFASSSQAGIIPSYSWLNDHIFVCSWPATHFEKVVVRLWGQLGGGDDVVVQSGGGDGG
jgi:hypothetical protein